MKKERTMTPEPIQMRAWQLVLGKVTVDEHEKAADLAERWLRELGVNGPLARRPAVASDFWNPRTLDWRTESALDPETRVKVQRAQQAAGSLVPGRLHTGPLEAGRWREVIDQRDWFHTSIVIFGYVLYDQGFDGLRFVLGRGRTLGVANLATAAAVLAAKREPSMGFFQPIPFRPGAHLTVSALADRDLADATFNLLGVVVEPMGIMVAPDEEQAVT